MFRHESKVLNKMAREGVLFYYIDKNEKFQMLFFQALRQREMNLVFLQKHGKF